MHEDFKNGAIAWLISLTLLILGIIIVAGLEDRALGNRIDDLEAKICLFQDTEVDLLKCQLQLGK